MMSSSRVPVNVLFSSVVFQHLKASVFSPVLQSVRAGGCEGLAGRRTALESVYLCPVAALPKPHVNWPLPPPAETDRNTAGHPGLVVQMPAECKAVGCQSEVCGFLLGLCPH